MGSKKKVERNLCKKKGKNNPGMAARLENMEREFYALKDEIRTRLGDAAPPTCPDTEET